MTDWTALGGNPVPGGPWSVRSAAGEFRRVAALAEETERDLGRVLGGIGAAAWRGPAADAARDMLAALLPDLRRLGDSHQQAGDSLDWYAGRLDDAQRTAQQAGDRATHAVDDRRRAQDRCTSWTTQLHAANSRLLADRQQLVAARLRVAAAGADPGYLAQWQRYEQDVAMRVAVEEGQVREAERQEQGARADVAAAGALLEAARRLAESAVSVRDEAARTTVQRLDAASRAGIQNRSTARRYWDETVTEVRHAAHSKGFKEFLDGLDDVATVVGAVGAVICLFAPEVGVFFLGAALALTALHLVGTALAYWAHNPEVGAGTLAWAVVDVVLAAIPFGKTVKALRAVGEAGRAEGEAVKAVRMVKRALAYDDNRAVRSVLADHGLSRTLLDDVLVAEKLAGKEAAFVARHSIDASRYYQVKTLVEIGHVAVQVVDQTRELDKVVQHRLVPPAEQSEPEELGHLAVRGLAEWLNGAVDMLPEDNVAESAGKTAAQEAVQWLVIDKQGEQ